MYSVVAVNPSAAAATTDVEHGSGSSHSTSVNERVTLIVFVVAAPQQTRTATIGVIDHQVLLLSHFQILTHISRALVLSVHNDESNGISTWYCNWSNQSES